MRNEMRALALAAVLLCAPAAGQRVQTLPAAATLTGAESMPAVQGSGCTSNTSPCNPVRITPTALGTFLGATFQPLDGDLSSIAAITATNSLIYRSALNSWAAVTLGPNFSFSSGSLTIPGLPITASGDATGATSSSSGALALTLASVNASPGACGSSSSLTVPVPTINAKGLVTGCSAYALGTAASYAIGTSGGVVGLLSGNNTYSGATTFSQAITGSVTGNAGTATKLATARTLAITGDLTWTSPAFDGSANVTAAGTLATSGVTAGSYTNASITVNAKGIVTAAANGTGGSGGSGTVTSVSVTTANGVSGTVANASTTPAITISLGAITPSSVVATGAISGGSASFTTPLPASSGGTGNAGGAWTTYTPTITSHGGTMTSATASGRYQLIGKVAHFSLRGVITTNGTGSAWVNFTLPFTSAAIDQVITSAQAAGGYGGYCLIPASTNYAACFRYDANYPGGDGITILATGVIETA